MISSLELARLCGVSQGTVDRALHDRAGISEETRRRILAAAAKHGYRANPAVMEVLRGTSATVGALIPRINHVFFLDLLEEVRAAIAPRGLRLLLTAAGTTSEFHDALAEFAARRTVAALVVPPTDDIAIAPTVSRSMPVVCFASPCTGVNVHYLTPDEVTTGRAATEHLLARGHHRILHLTYERRSRAIIDRADGYRAAMRVARCESTVFTDSAGESILARVSAARATALFCHNDWLALSAIRTLTGAGLRVPQDVSVLGVDASPTFTALYPGITTFSYPFAALAAQTALLIAGKSAGAAPTCALVAGTTVADA
ncbi:MAG: LacI family DNA-binding transcriptional regulator [Planctomycetes bacterium]|nr:LacI family DNA-binding transcriptional regulator [Planctomycetota bacterium]